MQLSITVISENKAAAIKIIGLKDTFLGIAVASVKNIPSAKGTIPKETTPPRIKPSGIPIADNFNAWPLTILLICFGDVPIVFKRP